MYELPEIYFSAMAKKLHRREVEQIVCLVPNSWNVVRPPGTTKQS